MVSNACGDVVPFVHDLTHALLYVRPCMSGLVKGFDVAPHDVLLSNMVRLRGPALLGLIAGLARNFSRLGYFESDDEGRAFEM